MKIENLAIISGKNTTIKDGKIIYKPEYSEINLTDISKPISADIRADQYFSQGILKFKFKATNYDSGVVFIHDADQTKPTFIGLSYYQDCFIIHDKESNTDLRSGNLKKYEPNQEIEIRIECFGSRCKLFVNNILFSESIYFSLKYLPIQFRITSTGDVIVYDIEVKSVKPKLFVVMQFTEEYNKLYEEVIYPITEKAGFECVRGDDFFTSTPILKDIISSIEESTAIIAEITPDNPNVFYEIGYSHAIKKPTILLCDKKREKLPFDISGFRTLFYENSIAGKSKVEKSLQKYLETIK